MYYSGLWYYIMATRGLTEEVTPFKADINTERKGSGKTGS